MKQYSRQSEFPYSSCYLALGISDIIFKLVRDSFSLSLGRTFSVVRTSMEQIELKLDPIG